MPGACFRTPVASALETTVTAHVGDVTLVSADQPATTTLENIDDRIDAWHDGDGDEDQPLHEYLGWTREQYAAWVERGEFPDE